MASSLIGSLRVALSLGTAEFEAGANKAASVAKSKGKEIEGSFAGAKRAVEGLLAAFTVGVLTEQIKKSLDYAGSLGEVSKTLGVTTKDLQTFRYAAGQSGVAQDQLEVGLRRLNASMGKAELGSKAQAKAFAAVMSAASGTKVSVEQATAKIKAMGGDTGQAFRLLADGLSKVTDRSQRAAVEMALMGRSGSTLDNLLAPGSKRLNELAEAAQKLGIVLSDSQIQGAEETAHKLEAVKEVLAAQIASVVADNAQSILTLASALGMLTGQITRFLGSNPTLALGIIGALAGKALGGGPIGIAIGAVAGATYGSQIDVPFNPGAKPNVALLTHNLATENKRLKEMDKLGGNIDPAAKGAQVNKVRRLTDTLNSALGRNGLAPPGTDLPDFLGGDKKPKHAKKGPEDKTEQDEFEFAQQQRQLNLQILQAKSALSHDYVEQTTLSIQMLDVEKAIKDAEIDHKVEQAKRDFAQKKITASTLAQIESEAKIEKAKEVELDGLKRQAVLEAEQEQRFHDVAALDQQRLDFQKAHLEDEAALAQTAKERRDLELKILDIDYQIQKAKLDEILADTQVSDADKEKARRALIALNQEQGLKRDAVLQQTQGPIESYLSSLPTTAAKWQEALQNVAVNGFGSLEQAILDTVSGTKKLGAAFGDMAKSIIADLIKIGVEKSIIAPLAQGLFGGQGQGGMGGLLGSLMGGSAAAGAGAGALSAGDMAFMDDTASMLAFADGGFVSGRGGPTSDSIPAMLSNGEFVMNSGTVRGFGIPFLNAMNTGQVTPQQLAASGKGGGGGGLGFLKYLSPVAMLASSGGGKGLLAALSPAAFLASKLFHFSQGGYVGGGMPIRRADFGGVPSFAGMGQGANGSPIQFNFHNHARMSDGEARRTGTQAAAGFNEEMARARRKGIS